MRAAASLHAQLAAIMETQANAALAQMCALVDASFELLRQEVTRSRTENEMLRRKLRLAETRTARADAPHAGGTAPGLQTLAHHPGNDPRDNRTFGGAVGSCRGGGASQDPPTDTGQPAVTSISLTVALVKQEDNDSEDESWSRSESDVGLCRVLHDLKQETEAPPPPTKQEEADVGGDSAQAPTNGEEASVQSTVSTGQRLEGGGYEGARSEPHFQHGRPTSQNPQSEGPSCGSVSENCGGGGSESGPCAAERRQPAVFTHNQQVATAAAAAAIKEPQVRPEASEGQTVSIGRDGPRRGDGVAGANGTPGGEKTFACQRCGKTLACLRNLKSHMRVHTGGKPYVCALCGKAFSDASNLKRHQSVHTGEKRYGCVHCGKRFAQSGTLKVHMSVHTHLRPFGCWRCGRTFASAAHLRRHAHSGEATPTPSSLGV